jgi:hypothetical protein
LRILVRKHISVLLATSAFAAAVGSLIVSADTAAERQVTIRIYNSFGVSLGQLDAAQQTAAAIFHNAAT